MHGIIYERAANRGEQALDLAVQAGENLIKCSRSSSGTAHPTAPPSRSSGIADGCNVRSFGSFCLPSS